MFMAIKKKSQKNMFHYGLQNDIFQEWLMKKLSSLT